MSSAFIGTSLEGQLRAAGRRALVVTGMQTNMCVSTTARMAGNLGFYGRHFAAQTLHDVALADLHGEFATVLDTAGVLGALEGT